MTRLTKNSYIKIALVCLLCLLICGSLSGAFTIFSNHLDKSFWSAQNRSWLSDKDVSAGSFTLDAQTVENLSINWLAGKVTVEVVDDETTTGLIQVTEKAHNAPALRWRNVAKTLEIDFGDINGLVGCSPRGLTTSKELTVLIPQSQAHRLENFTLNAASGEYLLSDIGCQTFVVNQASGNINVHDFQTERTSLSIASGSFSYGGTVTEALAADQASGASNIRLASSNPASVDLDMGSGKMDLTIPEPNFKVRLNKMSGDFASDYDLLSDGNTFFCKQGEDHGSHDADEHDGSRETAITMEMMSGSFKISRP